MARKEHRLWARALILLVAGGAVGCGATPTPQDPPPASLSEWSPDAALLDQLAEEHQWGGKPAFRIRPPKGYRKAPLDADPASRLAGARWISPPRKDGTDHRLLVMIGELRPGEAAPELGQFARSFLRGREELVGPMDRGPFEYGKLAGLPFVRVRWSATHPTTGKKSRGFAYLANWGRFMIMLDSQDVEPHDQSTLGVAEASALTFRLPEP